jgi:hypothetical protein
MSNDKRVPIWNRMKLSFDQLSHDALLHSTVHICIVCPVIMCAVQRMTFFLTHRITLQM